jgi:hypothetical protein
MNGRADLAAMVCFIATLLLAALSMSIILLL